MSFLSSVVHLAAQVVLEQAHQRRDLALRPLPVLDREGVERQHLEAQPGRGLDRLAHGLDAGAVALDARLAALLRPAAVAVHDDRDVTRQAREVDRTKDLRLVAAGGHDLEQVLQGHGGTVLASFRAYPSIG